MDLPAPLGPSSAVTPEPRAKLTSDTATTSPNHFDTPVASTIGRGWTVAPIGPTPIAPATGTTVAVTWSR